MTTVITYGTYDLLHYGHIRLLKRAKALGDYLIVGITADDFDKTRGKINVQQSLMERIEAVRSTGLADQIIVEEYEGQKIDDIRRYNVDIFAIGSDWNGHFDYLKDYCQVVYLERTEGVSSSEIRAEEHKLRLGMVGETVTVQKYLRESRYVNGAQVTAIYALDRSWLPQDQAALSVDNFDILLDNCDAVYIASHPSRHAAQVRQALERGKHVLCESPIATTEAECVQLFNLAEQNHLILMDSIKTAYSTAYNRLLLMLKGGKIGHILSVDATCTSLRDVSSEAARERTWSSICNWGPTALLPIFQILGTDWIHRQASSLVMDSDDFFDLFTRIDFIYKDAVASMKVGTGVKSEGELIVSGTKGYVYIPAPWWKTDYFEVRYENAENNRRYFYQLDGEGIRYTIAAFLKSINLGQNVTYVDPGISTHICRIVEEIQSGKNVNRLSPQ